MGVVKYIWPTQALHKNVCMPLHFYLPKVANIEFSSNVSTDPDLSLSNLKKISLNRNSACMIITATSTVCHLLDWVNVYNGPSIEWMLVLNGRKENNY